LTPFACSDCFFFFSAGSWKPRFLNSSLAIRFLVAVDYEHVSRDSRQGLQHSLVHTAPQICFGQESALILIHSPDLLHTGKIVEHDLLALS
jgi:hypothetical protein